MERLTTDEYLSITNPRTSSQENNKMKSFHQKVAIPLSLHRSKTRNVIIKLDKSENLKE